MNFSIKLVKMVFCLLLAFFIENNALFAQKQKLQYEIDLASNITKAKFVSVQDDKLFDLKIKNKSLVHNYSVVITKQSIQIEPLDFPTVPKGVIPGGSCTDAELTKLIHELNTQTTEKEVAEKVNQIEKKVKELIRRLRV